MAEHPFDLRISPFSSRIVEPLLAGALPFSTTTSFRILGFLALWAAAVAMFVLLRRLVGDDLVAGAGMLLFLSVGWATGYLLYNFWLPDGIAILCIVVLALAAVDRRPVLFAVVLVVGALTKEQVLLAAPLWWTLTADRLPDWRRLGEAVLLAAPAFLAFVAVRLLLPAGNDDAAYVASLPIALNAWDTLPSDPRSLYETFSPVRPRYWWLAAEWTGQVFGSLLVLGLAAPRRNIVTLLRWSPLVAGALLQPLLAANTHRLVVLAVPAAVVVATQGLQALRGRFGTAVLVAPVALLVLDLAGPRLNSRLLLDTAVLVAAGGIAIGLRRDGRMHP
jgi:hypothetical protein